MIQIDRIKFPFQFDVNKLHQEVSSLENIKWIRHLMKENSEGDWSVISLTDQEKGMSIIQIAGGTSENSSFESTPLLKICPYIFSILELFECNNYSVRLLKLSSGSEIIKQRDSELDESEVRVHIPIFTNEKVTFSVNDLEVKMNEGECWYLRLSDPHHVKNEGDTDLIHLELNLVLNDWIKDSLSD